jgi:hypothetical protein
MPAEIRSAAQVLPLLFWCAGFWTAIALFLRARGPGGRADPLRFLAGLVLGAVLAHLGWALLNLPALREHPAAWLDPSVGYSVLFLPAGVLLLAPWAGAAQSLPLALAVARTGCLVSGCCGGIPSPALPWGFHPTPAYEIGLLVALHFVVGRLEGARAVAAFLIGFGAIRLALEPLRAAAPLGEPSLPASWIAGLWVAAGLVGWAVERRSRPAWPQGINAAGTGIRFQVNTGRSSPRR